MKADFLKAAGLSLAFCVARVAFLGCAGVPPGAAYFFVCGEHPAPAYFDGPAGTALLVRAAALPGGGWWVGLGPLAGLAASLLLWRLAVRLFERRAALLAVVALNLLPVFNAQAFVPGPLLPAVALILAGATSVWDTSRRQTGGLGGWIVAGVAFAGAGLFSWWSLPFAAAALLAPFGSRATRRPAQILGASLAALLPLAAQAPSWRWLEANQWLPFAGWTPRMLVEFAPRAIGAGIVDLLIGLSPLLALGLLLGLFSLTKTSQNAAAAHFTIFLALPGLLLGGLAAYRGWEASQWVLPAAVFLLAPTCQHLPRSFLAATLTLAAAFSIPPWLTTLHESSAARHAAETLLALEERLAPDLKGGLFLIASDPRLAAALCYHLRDDFIAPPGQPRVFAAASQAESSQFALWKSYDQFEETPEPPDEFFTEVRAVNPFHGHAALYVGPELPDGLPTKIKGAFSEVQRVREVGEGGNRLSIYLCLNYKSPPL